jgi:hypothetical protein
VNVLDEQDERLVSRQLLEKLHPRGVELVAGRERMNPSPHVETKREAEDAPFPEPAERSLRGVALQNPEVLPEDLGEGPVGGSLAIREAAPRASQRLRTGFVELLPELADDPRLAEARISQDGHQLRATLRDCRLVGSRQPGELRLTPDEARAQAGKSTRAHQRQRPEEASRLDPLPLPLRLEDRGCPELEGAADSGCRARPDEHLAGLRSLFEARSDVDRVAADEGAARARRPDDDFAGVHADPGGKRVAEELAQPVLHGESCVQGPFGVIFLGRGRPKGCHHCVACELLDRAPGGLDLRRHRGVEALQKHADALGVLLARLRRRPDQVGEEDRRDLALVARRARLGGHALIVTQRVSGFSGAGSGP